MEMKGRDMKVVKYFLLVLLLVLGNKVFAFDTQTACPPFQINTAGGWAILSESNTTQCYLGPGGFNPNTYVLAHISVNGVGQSYQGSNIVVCGAANDPIPSPYVKVFTSVSIYCNPAITPTNALGISCSGPCIQPPPSGSIGANPTTVNIPYVQLGSTTINFNSANLVGQVNACIWVRVDGGAMQNGNCYPPNQPGSETETWIQAGHQYIFYLYEEASHVLLGQVTVNGVSDGTPTISVSPNPVSIPAGQSSAPITISWNAPGYGSVSLYGSNSLPPYNGGTFCLGSGFPASDSINGHAYPGEVAHLYVVSSD